jgi:hypothetical protein
LQGLKADDWSVLNPPDSLDEGVQVNVKEAQTAAPAATGNTPASSPANAPSPNGAKPAQGDKK